MHEITIGIDLGGTRIKAVAIDVEGKVWHQSYTATQDGDDRIWKQKVSEAIEEIKTKFPQSSYTIGISAPGLPNETYTAIACMPGRMQGLENFMWANHLKHPSYVLNDGVASMMAEAKFGAAKKSPQMQQPRRLKGGAALDGKKW